MVKLDQRDRAPRPYLHELEQLARNYTTDKNDHSHNYMPMYIDLFGHRKEEQITLLELGTADRCRSTRMWGEYFHNGQIIGIDWEPRALRWNRGNIKVLAPYDFSKEEDVKTLRGLLPEVDYIIDDASHDVHDIILCHSYFWDLVKPGGAYVIEDTSKAYLPERRGKPQGTQMIDYFGKIIAALNGTGRPNFHNYKRFKEEGYPYGNDWTTRIEQIRFQAELIIMDYRKVL